jgi:hypothetical protein
VLVANQFQKELSDIIQFTFLEMHCLEGNLDQPVAVARRDRIVEYFELT